MKTATLFALSLLFASVVSAQPVRPQPPNPWTFLGPRPIGYQWRAVREDDGFVGPKPITGRVLSVAVVDANTVYVGTAGGGVWKTTDGGINWEPKTDSQPNLTIGALALDPVNRDVVYAGTGEFNFYYDEYKGVGILRSTDAGETWRLLPDPNGVFAGVKIGRIAIDPSYPKSIYVATNRGLIVSLNGGQSWDAVRMGTCSQISDVVVDDNTIPSTIYVATSRIDTDWDVTDSDSCGGVWKSKPPAPFTLCVGSCFPQFAKLPTATFAVDAQKHYTPPNGIPLGNMIRLALERYQVQSTGGRLGRLNPNQRYQNTKVALYVANEVRLGPDAFDLRVFRSEDGGDSWKPLALVAPGNYPCWGIAARRIPASGGTPERDALYVLSMELFASLDSGNSWQNVTSNPANEAQNRKVHHDLHGFDFVADAAGKFFFGTDGGVYKSEDYGRNITNLNQTLANVTFYRGAVSGGPTPTLLGSMQDNGFVRSFGTISPSYWMRVEGGDGGSIVWDPQDEKRVYIARTDDFIKRSKGDALVIRSTDGGVNFQPAGMGIATPADCDLLAPLVMDPKNPKHLFFACNQVYESADGAATWHLVGGPSPAGFPADGNKVTAVAMASDSSAVYASHDARVFKFANATWTDITYDLANLDGVRTMAVDPTNPNTVYAGAWGPAGTKHVRKLVGNNWVVASTNLPDAAVNSIVINPANPQDIFAGTDQGSYRSINGGQTWLPISGGMPNAVAIDLVLDRWGKTLYVFTHGRGVWRANIADLPTHMLRGR